MQYNKLSTQHTNNLNGWLEEFSVLRIIIGIYFTKKKIKTSKEKLIER